MANRAPGSGSLQLKPAHRTTGEQFHDTIAANLTTAFATVRSATRVMGRRGGAIVLVSSAAATIELQNHEASYAARGVRVNAIAPGMVETPLTAALLTSSSARDASLALHPSGRAGQPEELASLIAWLLGSEAAWVTGQVWGIDGGLGSVKLRPVTKLRPAGP